MKLACQKSILFSGLQLLGPVILGTSTKPILQAVKLEAGEGRAVLEATDLEIGVRCVVEPVDVEEAGTIVLQEGRLAELLREWPEEKILMESKGTMCQLSGKGGVFKMAGYDPEEFPVIPSFSEEGSIEMEAGELEGMVKKVVFACATERVRHTMTGVLFRQEGGELKMVATDGRRLAYVKGRKITGGKAVMEGIVPKRGVELLSRIATHQGGKVALKMDDTHFLAKSGGATLCTQLIEGQYPNYEEAIPRDNDKKVEVDTEQLASALRRATVLTTEERHLVKLKLQKGKMVVEAETPEVGEAVVDVPVDYAGEELEIGFNPDFLVDALKAIGKSNILLEFKGPTTAAVMKKQDCLYVVMPIRLAEAA
jgi:DNA polymerase III beta subunit